MTEPTPTGFSRRTWFALLMPVLLVVAWFGGKAIIRAYVDTVIQASAGRSLPAFDLVDRSGESWSPARLRGKPVVLHFFRSRCESCEVEAPEYRRLEAELPPAAATILHVMTDAVLGFATAETAATLEHKEFRRPVLMADEAFVDAFHTVQWSQVTPVTYIVDGDLMVREARRGKQTADALLAAVSAVR